MAMHLPLQALGAYLGHLMQPQNQSVAQPQPGPTATPDPALSEDEMKRRTLIQNLIDQTAYTPAAEDALNNLKVNFRPYSDNLQGGDYNPAEPNTVNLNSATSPEDLASILAHEFLHSQDANVNHQDAGPASYPAAPGQLANSRGFYPASSPDAKSFIRNRTQGPLYDNSPAVRDIEGMAYVGQDGESVMADSPTFQRYLRQIYLPMSKVPPSYSPVYPNWQTFMRQYPEEPQ